MNNAQQLKRSLEKLYREWLDLRHGQITTFVAEYQEQHGRLPTPAEVVSDVDPDLTPEQATTYLEWVTGNKANE